MNSEEFDQEIDEREAEEILRRNEPFRQKALAQIRKQKAEKERRRRKIIVRLSSACAAVVVVFCCVFFPLYCQRQEQPKIPVYFNDNIKSKEISWNQWGNESVEFIFTLNENYLKESLEMNYDSLSNDTLFYCLNCSFNYNDNFGSMWMWLYTNPYYRDETHELLSGTTFNFSSFSLVYNETQEVQEGIYSYNTVGKIEQGNELIYISYTETSLEAQSNFTQFVSELVRKK